MILKPTRVLENKDHLLEIADLLLELRQEVAKRNPDSSIELQQWATEQAVMRLGIKDGHDYGDVV